MGKKNKNKGQGAPTPAPEDADKSAALAAALELDAVADKAPDQEATAPAEAVKPVAKPKVSAARTKDEVVKDKNGKALFTKKAPTLNEQGRTAHTVAKPKSAKPEKRRMKLHSADGTHSNPRYLKFPADKWGLTKDLKSALISVASRTAGDERKMAVVQETLRVGLAHLDMKFQRDKAAKDARQVPVEVEAAE